MKSSSTISAHRKSRSRGTEDPWRQRRYVDYVGRERYEDTYRNLVIEFRDLIAEDREPSPSAADGRAALEMILAAYEASNTGSRVKFPYNGNPAPAKWVK